MTNPDLQTNGAKPNDPINLNLQDLTIFKRKLNTFFIGFQFEDSMTPPQTPIITTY